MKNFVFLGLAVLSLCACSQTKYMAHVAKQIPMGVDTPTNKVGHFKVGSPYTIKGRRYFPQESYNLVESGVASWYGPGFHGKQTANGEIFDQTELTAAHRTLQLPSIIRVTNLENGRSVIMRVNDRGPFAHERILDVSERGAVVLGFKRQGTAKIRLEVLGAQSREVANMARAGKSTRGYEVAYNQGQRPIAHTASAQTQPVAVNRAATPQRFVQKQNHIQQPVQQAMNQSIHQLRAQEPITRVAMNETVSLQRPSAPIMNDGALQSAISPAAGSSSSAQTARQSTQPAQFMRSTQRSKLFVQAGAFSNRQNASNYQQQIAKLGPTEMYPVQVNNQPYYRVRLGPFADQSYATQVLSMLQQSGNQNAKLITE
jgi:rare lipoprotein A